MLTGGGAGGMDAARTLVFKAPVVVGVPLKGPWDSTFVTGTTGAVTVGVVMRVVVGDETTGTATA